MFADIIGTLNIELSQGAGPGRSSESFRMAPLRCYAIAQSDSNSFLTICLILYSGSLKESEVLLRSDDF